MKMTNKKTALDNSDTMQADKDSVNIRINTSTEKLDEQFARLVTEKGLEVAADMLAKAIIAAINSGKIWQVRKTLNARCLAPESIGNFAAYVQFRCGSDTPSGAVIQGADDADSAKPDSFGWNNLVKAERLLAGKRIDEALLALHYQSPVPASCTDLVSGEVFATQLAILTARALVAAGRYDDAHHILDTAMETAGKLAALLHTKGNTARAQGKNWLATKCYLDAVEQDPGFSPAYVGLQFGLGKARNLWDRATTVLERVNAEAFDEKQKPAIAALHRLYELQEEIGKATLLNRHYVGQMANKKFGKPVPSSSQAKQPRLDFLIVGAQKCGTTSLFSWLGHHPRALLPHTKEIGFFATNRYDHGLEWYLSHFSPLCDHDHYFTGESTPTYFSKTALASRQIQQSLGSVKIIMLLRNPASRTLSAYYHILKMGGKHGQSMEEDIDKWISDYRDADATNLDNSNPVAISVYAPRVRRWFDIFGKKNCLVLNADDLFAHPQNIMPRVFSFLGVDSVDISYGVANAGTYNKGQEYERVRAKLLKFFEPSIRELEELIGQQTNWLVQD